MLPTKKWFFCAMAHIENEYFDGGEQRGIRLHVDTFPSDINHEIHNQE